MFAPLALVFAAPVALILRSATPRTGKAIVHVLRSRPAEILTNPVVLVVANLGGLALLYCTPLYSVTTSNLLLHELVHIHFFTTGYLFAWMIAGPDPGPHRPTVPIRIVVLESPCSATPSLPNFSTLASSSKYRHQRRNCTKPVPSCTTGVTSPKSSSRSRCCSPGSQSGDQQCALRQRSAVSTRR